MSTPPAVVLIGGGTGSFTLLQALKEWTPDVTALVNMADDGGSTGVLRDELGVLPPGDVRQCLVALSDAPQELRDLFNFRFPSGSLEGHSFGNIFLSAVESMTGNFADGIRIAGDVLRITGQVLPITLDNCQLVLHQDGETITGEHRVASTPLTGRPDLSLQPQARLNPDALQAIARADLIIIAPGNLYGSLAPALLTDGLAAALEIADAPIAYVCNLVNKSLQTEDYDVATYAEEVERFAGGPVVDYVLYNIDHPDPALLEKYALKDEFPVRVDESALRDHQYQPVPGHFLSRAEHARNAHDTRIKRSLIRHDAVAVTAALRKLLGRD